ncbi:MAG: Holliday junction branch migration protein RuvA [Clostridia bacterium]|nr:Holliday junction branch migration protein RuvA [Clostridia bacterium]
MFDYLTGTVAFLGQNTCVVDTHGIGWSLIVSDKSAGRLARQKEKDREVRVYTYLNCGSSDRAVMELYGFALREERDLFTRLIGVSGIGPKAAVAILSALDVDELIMCILSGDAKSIARAQGVGLKTAQKLILELKDKVAKSGAEAAASPEAAVPGGSFSAEAVNALVVLGYPVPVAAAAVRKAEGKATDLEHLIRLALKSMNGEEK